MAKSKVTKLKDKAQKLFNEYIRERDRNPDGTWTCIACGNTVDKINAGHYFGTRRYDWLRYNPDNVHGECTKCNSFNHEHLIWYGLNLRIKLGDVKYWELISKAKERPKKLTALQEERELYKIIYRYETFKKTRSFPTQDDSTNTIANFDPDVHASCNFMDTLYYYR
ncbi:MAG TPA: recombination protein NinG [Candidatus Paceibacterota bacterium]|nr:recombination protein NinG [Candidatus Paceibacterota bacterium]